MRIAVIGAGLAGLTAAGALQHAGHAVVVWEKSRGVGGRTATRRAGSMRFDHGAPFLHDGASPLAEAPTLAQCRLHTAAGVVLDVAAAAPTGNALAKTLAADLDVRTGVRVAPIAHPRPGGQGWQLVDVDGAALGSYDALVIAVPAPQAAELLARASPELAARASTVQFTACWSAMVAWPQPLHIAWSVARDEAGVSVALREPAKLGRAAGERWVIQADPALSAQWIDDDGAAVAQRLVDRFAALVGRELPEPAHLAAHRWLYARALTPIPESVMTDGTLIVAGDWCGGTTAGAALRSGTAAAAALAMCTVA
jgi:renalase